MRSVVVVLAAASVSLGGCVTPTEVANPNAITLRQAVMEVTESLHEARGRYPNQPKIGLYPSEATVTFNVSSQSTETTGLQVGASVPAAVVPVPITASFSDQIVASGTRGNQVTIKFKNILELPKGAASAGNQNDSKSADAKKDKAKVGTAAGPDWMKCFAVRGPYPDYCNAVTMQERMSPEMQQRFAPLATQPPGKGS
ncbi:hypothetical protein [Tardiphaga sp. 839_C3_N1_4]|uniref:hypothetical protein n=1 Tax=Tardiphaga sp. 839_C3_N1_4 TaxID=3240761 RepID=UPI003F1ED3A5